MSNPQTSDAIISTFDRERSVYSAFAARIKTLVEDLVGTGGISLHSVTARTKDRKSLETKLQNRDPPYASLRDITDIAGIRIITYFPDDVDRVGKLIEAEFAVDRVNSVDKRSALDPDRFGYLSLHYVVSLSSARNCLAEYKPYQHRKCEIQVRSVLQHAWAEIEHDLGYKAAGEVPRDIRRRFSRVAGLLELADLEFQGIRADLAEYAQVVSVQVQTAPSTVLLDAVSLTAFIRTNKLVEEIDRNICDAVHVSAITDDPRPELAVSFPPLGVSTIEELKRALDKFKSVLVPFAIAWLGEMSDPVEKKPPSVRRGISVLYLRNVMLGAHPDASNIGSSIFRHVDAEVAKRIVKMMTTIYQRTVQPPLQHSRNEDNDVI